jgi:hypothetical protein
MYGIYMNMILMAHIFKMITKILKANIFVEAKLH